MRTLLLDRLAWYQQQFDQAVEADKPYSVILAILRAMGELQQELEQAA